MSSRLNEQSIYSHLNTVFKYILSAYLDEQDIASILSVMNVEEFDIANLLGIDLRYKNDYALRIASGNGHFPVIQFLIEKGGADIHVDDEYALKIASKDGYENIVKYLVEKGSDIHADNEYALRMASLYGHLHIVQYLVEKGADIHAHYDCALRYASEHGYLPIVQYLFSKGADINAVVIERCHENVVQYFCSQKRFSADGLKPISSRNYMKTIT